MGRLGLSIAAACLLLGCATVSPPIGAGGTVSRVSFDDGFRIAFADGFPRLDLVRNGRAPDGSSYEVRHGETKLLYVIEGVALGFPLGPDGFVRRQRTNPVAVNIVGGRIKEYRFRYHRDGRQDIYVQVMILPSDGPDRDLAERIAASIRVD